MPPLFLRLQQVLLIQDAEFLKGALIMAFPKINCRVVWRSFNTRVKPERPIKNITTSSWLDIQSQTFGRS